MDSSDILKLIEETRISINHEKQLLKNANFRLGLIPDDEFWLDKKTEVESELLKLQMMEERLIREYLGRKNIYNAVEWRSKLEDFGTSIAKTSGVLSIRESMNDEFELHKAIDSTINVISSKKEEYESAKNNHNEDLMVIINSELEYYKSDITMHHWGEQALEKLDWKESKSR